MPGVVGSALVFAVALLPVLGLVPFDFQIYSTVADHYVYLAMLGPALALAWLIAKFQRTSLVIPATALLAGLGIMSFRQSRTWRDTRTALGHTLDVNPKSWMSHINLAVDALGRQDADDAIAHSRAALDLRPNDGRIHVNLGRALGMNDDIDGAITEFRTAIALHPNDPAAHANLADALAYRGDLDGAIREYRAALAIDPQHRSAARGLEAALSRQRQSRPRDALPR
jgi:Flp pilus assembly protein TadD